MDPAPTDGTRAVAERPKRPALVTLVGAVAVAVAVYSVAFGALILQTDNPDRLADGIFHFALGAGALIAGLGALRLHRWAWTAFMTWAVIGLTVQILRYLFFGDPNYTSMAINTFAVLVLSPLEVQVAFGLAHAKNAHLARPSRNPLDRD